MSGPIDVVDVLRRANPVPPGSIDEDAYPTAAELRAALRPDATTVVLAPWDGPASHLRRRWPRYAAAAVAAGVAALSLVPGAREEPVTTTPPPSPFLGTWESIDVDGSLQVMEVTASGDEHEIVVRDDAAQVCAGSPSTMTGTGRLDADGSLVIPQPDFVCDDGSTPVIEGGPPVEDALAGLTFVHGTEVDKLVDSFGVVWRRPSADGDGDSNAAGQRWPQSSADEVGEAQGLADEGDPSVAWQVDAQLAGQGVPYGAEILTRFLGEELGWESFLPDPFAGFEAGEGTYAGIVFVRCSPGRTNPLYPDHPEAAGCAPTIDDRTYEAVRISLSQPARRGPTGIWVVSGWAAEVVTQAVPPSDADTAALLDVFLDARVAGEGAEAPLAPEIPLLYATTAGAPYERFEITELAGPEWPTGDREVTVELFADGGSTVVEQLFVLTTDSNGRRALNYEGDRPDRPSTTENGRSVAESYTFLDGEVTFGAAWPWSHSFAGWDHSPIVTTLLLDGAYEERLALVADPLPVAAGCQAGPAPESAEALAGSILADSDLSATEPVAVTIAGIPALRIDVTVAPGASECAEEGTPIALAGVDWAGVRIDDGERLRLYLLDVPAGSARILAVAVYAPEARFEQVLAAATPIVESLELHPG